MSDAIIFNYPYNLFLMERLEFVLLAQDDLEAKIMRLVEYEMIKKKEKWQAKVTEAIDAKKAAPEEPSEYWCQLSHAQIIGKLYKFDTTKVGAKHPLSISKATIRKALNNIIEKGWLLTRTAPDDEFGAPQYTLNRQTIQAAMNLLPKDPFSLFYLDKTPLRIFKGGDQNNSGAPSEFLGGGDQNNSGGDLKIFEDLKDSSKDSFKDGNKESSYLPTGEQPSFPLATATAAAVSLTQLKNLSPEDLAILKAEIDALLITQPGDTQDSQHSEKMVAAPVGQNDQKEQNIGKEVEVVEEQRALERPGVDAPRTAATVVQLIEYLRGSRYTTLRERSNELRKAGVLLSQKDVPDISIAEIEEAWLHGSDDYWRSKHGGDDLHVHDLVNKDSNGKLRIQAFLEHKRAQDRRQRPTQSLKDDQRAVFSAPPTQPPVVKQSTLSEEQAQAIVEQIAVDAAEHGYKELHGELHQQASGWMVQVSWRSPAWKKGLNLEITSAQEWRKEFKDWHDILQMREKRRQQAAGVPVGANQKGQED
jgi:hypothetical protein